MKLTINDLREYAVMNTAQRHDERGKAIRAEIEERMRWMPIGWRRLIRCRYILGYGAIKTGLQIGISERTVRAWTSKIARWLEDKDAYLNELV